MKAPLSAFQVFHLAGRKVFPLAAVLAVLFTLGALVQYTYVTRKIRATTVAELTAEADRMRQELAFTNSWNLEMDPGIWTRA
jgi:branched-subunit amino acid ABC-type transport system permease component